MRKENCPHCDPYDGKDHPNQWARHVMFPAHRLSDRIIAYLKREFSSPYFLLRKIFIRGFFNSMIGVGILREQPVLDTDQRLYNRTMVVAEAAKKRGVTVKTLDFLGKKETDFFTMMVDGKKLMFEALPSAEIGLARPLDIDNKFIFKEFLGENGFPRAEGRSFHVEAPALAYAGELGFPVVVKPIQGSLSKHVVCDVRNERELRDAIRIAQMIDREFVLEKFIAGDVYRVTIVNRDYVACCLREAPNVVGDGAHTVQGLIEIKNGDPRRGEPDQRNATLHKIRTTSRTLSLLKKNGFSLESVPSKGKKVYLHDKVVLACGADIHDKTDVIHPDNKSLFLELSRILNVAIVGIDFICQDISKSYREQPCAVIEANSLPYIDMHHFPVTGTPRDVAGYIIDALLKKK